MDTPPSANLRSRSKPSQMATASPNGLDSPSVGGGRRRTATQKPPSSSSAQAARNSPFLPTPTEALALCAYPLLLVFGTLFSLLSPETRAAPYDHVAQTHYAQDASLAPSYFARKGNLFNVLFVKRGWAWVTAAFFAFALTHPALRGAARSAARLRAVARYALVTLWWVLVTQWCFGPALIDRGFRYTGGKCDVAEARAAAGDADAAQLVTAVACKGAGGRWAGGHDISGHVFLLVLGSVFLAQEVGWVVARGRRAAAAAASASASGGGGKRDERSVVMRDGAVKSAEVEAEAEGAASAAHGSLTLGGRLVAAVVALSLWMLLMTAIYFHTWFEKLTGLLVALAGLYAVYVLPRSIALTNNFRFLHRVDRASYDGPHVPSHDLIEAIPAAPRHTFVSHIQLNFPRDRLPSRRAGQRAMAPIKVPSNLPEVVRSAFNKAVASGDVTHYATQVVVLTVNSIPVRPPRLSTLAPW
ncbi:uncharacterized protein E0L32_007024 [Thyridium curvatum]|uniref:Acyl-coenzyme A diphosphatase SCS3 n=1 Tax=Thyridium curvatum TaxID=1093900 RepID=A0A507AXZ9_9PEZI|nr:uncharacterized protein E0L32_007024 [Thyridium curvatum]TPX12377.1 hypothetical protein E0L32_007024 [Thyridium curvatum]